MILPRALAVLSVSLLSASFAAAQGSAPVSKIAFVDVERAVLVIDEGKARLKELDEWAGPRQGELGRLNQEINTLGGELNARRGAVPDAELNEMNRRLVAKQREFEDKQRAAKREFDERQAQLFNDLGSKLNEVVSTYAQENGFTAVFILKPNDVIYLASSADITDMVIGLYNQKYPYPGVN